MIDVTCPQCGAMFVLSTAVFPEHRQRVDKYVEHGRLSTYMDGPICPMSGQPLGMK